MSGLVIVGAGECGMRAALSARDAGFVGPLTVIGDEAEVPYERPPLSKPDALGAYEKPIVSLETLSAQGIELKNGVSAVGIDRASETILLSDESTLPYDKLLLATGARARTLNCPGGQTAKVLRTVDDARAIYAQAGPDRNAVIIGAGLIGLELAAELTKRGSHVTVLEAGPRPLARNVPERLALRLAASHRARGVDIICDVDVASCDSDFVHLSTGKRLNTDLVVAAIGVDPNIDLAMSAGLAVHNGIQTDARLMTNDPRIYAAGDCASVQGKDGVYRRFETWQNAQAQGETAGRNLAGGDEVFHVPVWFWSDQYELGLQCVGDTSGSCAVVRSTGIEAEILFWLDADDRLLGAAGLGPGNTIAKDIKIAQRLIGAQMDPTFLSDPALNLKKLLRAA